MNLEFLSAVNAEISNEIAKKRPERSEVLPFSCSITSFVTTKLKL